MWVYERDLNYTAFIKSPDFPDLFHKITECWLYNGMILFEFNSSFYILVKSESTNGGFYNDFGYRSGSGFGTIFRDYFYISGSTITYNTGVPRGQKFVKIKTTTCQNGEYVYNVGSKKWEAQLAANSDPISDLTQDYFDAAELYKSTSLLGVYKWQSTETVKADLKVGWHYYTHKELDSEGQQTQNDVNVYEGNELTGGAVRWSYDYQNITYYYVGELPEGNIIMQATFGEILNLNFVELVALNNDVWKFDGGAQIVL